MSNAWVFSWDYHTTAVAMLMLSCICAVGVNISQFACLGRFSAVSFQARSQTTTFPCHERSAWEHWQVEAGSQQRLSQIIELLYGQSNMLLKLLGGGAFLGYQVGCSRSLWSQRRPAQAALARVQIFRMPAQVLGHSKTVLVLLGGWAFLGDRVSGRQAFGMALAVAGMVAYGLASSQCGPLTGMVPPGFSPVRKSARLRAARARQQQAPGGAASRSGGAEGRTTSAQVGLAQANTRHRPL